MEEYRIYQTHNDRELLFAYSCKEQPVLVFQTSASNSRFRQRCAKAADRLTAGTIPLGAVLALHTIRRRRCRQ